MKKSFDFFIVLLFCGLVFLAGCSSRRAATAPGNRDAGGINPFEYGDEFAVRTPGGAVHRVPEQISVPGKESPADVKNPVASSAAISAVKAESDSTGASAEAGAHTGDNVYRVQIGIYEEQNSAEKRAEEARSRVSMDVYVEFEPPFYRVRVGDFKTREEAENYVKILQDFGFRSSFWVRKNFKTP